MIMSPPPTTPKVAGSHGLTPNSIDDSTRAPASAAASPNATPAPTSTAARPTTSRTMSDWPAPTARRMPISCVRWRTVYDSTP
jgi:hypothetical protein